MREPHAATPSRQTRPRAALRAGMVFLAVALSAAACSIDPVDVAITRSGDVDALETAIDTPWGDRDVAPVDPDPSDLDPNGLQADPTPTEGPDAVNPLGGDQIQIPVTGTLRWGECDFVEISEYYADHADCGWLTRDAARPGREDFVLPVVRFRARSEEAKADPIIYLHGGPGGGRVTSAEALVDAVLWRYNETRDIIVFDQRASGIAEPEISCLTVLLSNEQIAFRTLRNCLDRMRLEGVDVEDLTLAASADDVAALIRELDAAPAILYGASWGGRLAIEAANRHPQAVRAVVLDSPLVPDYDLVGAMPQSFLEAISNLEAQCESDPDCSAANDLTERFSTVADRLEDDPVEIELIPYEPLAFGSDTIDVGGAELASLFFSMLYRESETAAIPDVIADLEAGDTRLLSRFVALNGVHAVSDPPFLAYICNDLVPLSSRAAVAEARTGIAVFDTIDEIPDGRGPTAFDICNRVKLGDELPDHSVAENPPPMVVLAGLYDPITPHSASADFAEANAGVDLITVPKGGHVVGDHPCAQDSVVMFLDDPTAEVADCATDWTPHFDDAPLTERPPAAADVSKETTAGGGTIDLLVPSNWMSDWFEADGDLADVWWRDHTAEDQTAFVIFDEADGDAWLDFYSAYPSGSGDDIAGWSQERLLSGNGVAFARFERDGIVLLIQTYPEELDTVVGELVPVLESVTVTG